VLTSAQKQFELQYDLNRVGFVGSMYACFGQPLRIHLFDVIGCICAIGAICAAGGVDFTGDDGVGGVAKFLTLGGKKFGVDI
jgi:hypothetical protein